MDPLTHSLLGAVTGYALFGRKLGPQAAAIGAVAAVVPDLDFFIRSASDPLLKIEYHRHFTHAIAFAPVGALLGASPWLLRERWRPQRWSVWLCALAAFLTHCLLDASTSYGTQILWPFTNLRVGWNLVSIIDPLVTLALAGGVIGALWKKRSAPAFAGLIFFAAYLFLGGIQHARALKAQVAVAELRGHHAERGVAMPTLGNNLVWRSLYQYEGRIYSDRLRVGWFSSPRWREGTSLPLVTQDDLTGTEVRRDQERGAFQRFAWFSDGWVARSPNDSAVLGDMRYSLSTEAFDPIWGIRFKEGRPHFEWVSRSRDRKLNLRQLWREIVGNDPDYQPVADAAGD